jgi:hypothetical protein
MIFGPSFNHFVKLEIIQVVRGYSKRVLGELTFLFPPFFEREAKGLVTGAKMRGLGGTLRPRRFVRWYF